VVSIGNLVVGGTGKTPMAAWIANALLRRGYKVALCTRGYGGTHRRRGVLVVSDGHYVRSRSEVAGDEAMLLAGVAPGVPVLVGRDRIQVGLRAYALFGAEVLVLDDGFQHHRLQRDVDLITIDGSFGFGNRWVLPRGPLREPLSALRYADAVAIIDGPLDPTDAATLQLRAPNATRFAARRRPVSIRPLRGGAAESPDVLNGTAVGLIAGLARPESLRSTLLQLGARIVAERTFSDHHRYRRADLVGLAREASLWITTAKDALKITPDWIGGADVRVLEIELDVAQGDALVKWIESKLLRAAPSAELDETHEPV
jgi:tetraacyldisaccharide 4'-kinase